MIAYSEPTKHSGYDFVASHTRKAKLFGAPKNLRFFACIAQHEIISCLFRGRAIRYAKTEDEAFNSGDYPNNTPSRYTTYRLDEKHLFETAHRGSYLGDRGFSICQKRLNQYLLAIDKSFSKE